MIPTSYRLGGKNFTNTYNFLKASEKWNEEKIRKYQNRELNRLLKHAVKHVDYYKNINLNSKNAFKNLKKFPIIDKKIIRKNLKKFFADNIPRKETYYVTTGGTTGEPFGFYLDNSIYGKEWAFVMMGWRRVGFNPGDKVVSFRGIEFKKSNKSVFWQENPIYNMLEMSPFHINERNLPKYVPRIKKYKPKYIHGYPSAIYLLAEFLDRKGINFPPVKGVLAVSENVYPEQREFIENIFDTRLFSFYGMSEKVVMAPECEYDLRYHPFPEYGLTEIIDHNGNHVGLKERGEVVGTSFLNYNMPFIRYRTEDTAVFYADKCSKCNRDHLILDNLIGRGAKDFVFGFSGTKIPFNALYIAIHSNIFSKVLKFQFYQKEFGKIIIRIVTKKDFSKIDEKKFKNSIYKRVGDDLKVEIQKVEDIQLTQRGKSKILIQEIKL